MTPAPLIISRDEAARLCGYDGASCAFDLFARKMGFKRVPHRRGFYYRDQIKATLDKEMGLAIMDADTDAENWLKENA